MINYNGHDIFIGQLKYVQNSYDQSLNVILLLAVFLFFFSLRVRGQHTKTTGRRGRTVGVSKKK